MINNEGLLKIVDFGVAAAQKEGDTQLTKTGYVIGSPKYMAPEQILGKKVDQRADIYSVGVIMYEMITGAAALQPRRPHVGDVPARAGQGEGADRREPAAAARRCRTWWPGDVGRQDEAPPDAWTSCGWRWRTTAPVAVRSAPHGPHRRIPQARHRPGLLGHPFRRRPAADAAHARRPDADQVPRPEPGGARRLHRRDRQQAEPGPAAQGPRRRLLVRVGERRALPRQRVPQGHRRRRDLPRDSRRCADARPARRCRRSSRSCATTTRA